MAYSQIDPARLRGDALTRWYRRSPSDIEQERQAAETQRYNAFVGQLRPTSQDALPDWGPATSGDHNEAGPNTSWSSQTGSIHGSMRLAALDALEGNLAQRSQVATAVPTCTSCHGSHPEIPRPFPFPPSLPLWFFRDGQGSTPSKPPERDRKQCEIQDQRDREICGSQPTPEAKAVCNETASLRYQHCLRTGEINMPKDLYRVR
jgi:cytochrome c553